MSGATKDVSSVMICFCTKPFWKRLEDIHELLPVLLVFRAVGWGTNTSPKKLVFIGREAEHVPTRRIHPDLPISERPPAVAVDNRVSMGR